MGAFSEWNEKPHPPKTILSPLKNFLKLLLERWLIEIFYKFCVLITILCSLKAYGQKKYIFLNVLDISIILVFILPHLGNFKVH